jgi:hypothetical protein
VAGYPPRATVKLEIYPPTEGTVTVPVADEQKISRPPKAVTHDLGNVAHTYPEGRRVMQNPAVSSRLITARNE